MIFATYITDKGLKCRIYKTSIRIKNKLMEKWAKDIRKKFFILKWQIF